MPALDIRGKVGRSSSFEVKVNGVLVHSKLECGAFPDLDQVVDIAVKASQGMEPTKVSQFYFTPSVDRIILFPISVR